MSYLCVLKLTTFVSLNMERYLRVSFTRTNIKKCNEHYIYAQFQCNIRYKTGQKIYNIEIASSITFFSNYIFFDKYLNQDMRTFYRQHELQFVGVRGASN